MPLEPVKPKVLAARIIPRVNDFYHKQLDLLPEEACIGMITATSDDATYVSLDHATKAAQVRVVYAESFYAGAGAASGPLSGEVIGIISGTDPSEVKSGLDAAIQYLEESAWFYTGDDDGHLVFFPHVISRAGAYLSDLAQVPFGSPLSYLIAPPIEAMYAMDRSLKEADVQMQVFWGPPSHTNFAGCLLTGSQSACQESAKVFSDAIIEVAANPMRF